MGIRRRRPAPAGSVGLFFPALYLGAQRLPGSVAAIVLAAQPSLTVFWPGGCWTGWAWRPRSWPR
ncbi:MAG TPA: hypothetical protein VFD49_12990 [Candidatus Dormibacteraeota bacterium]|nr:hypothetical protein [Candidatus Dormibacteraeota bacterium]